MKNNTCGIISSRGLLSSCESKQEYREIRDSDAYIDGKYFGRVILVEGRKHHVECLNGNTYMHGNIYEWLVFG